MGKFHKLRHVKGSGFLFRMYDFVMHTLGLFHLKAKIKQKRLFRQLKNEDAKKKREIDELIYSLPDKFIENMVDCNDFVFSLTSYSYRVKDTLPYALYSIITQSIKPRKIVVYLDSDNWNEENIPNILKKLRKVGVCFRFCEDIKSYKKLIPALIDFPDNPIITLDDDFYYYKDYHCDMKKAYEKSNKKTVLGHWGCIPEKKEGKYIPYNEWKDIKYMKEGDEVSFFGCCCCYPPHIFDEEILKKEIFMKLCPTADDIWFWVMEKRLGIKTKLIEPCGYGLNTPVNRIEEYDLSQKGTLMYQNVTNGKNNKQLIDLIEYYNLT